MTNNMRKERGTFTNYKGLDMYNVLGLMGVGFDIMIRVVTAPFILEGKLLDSLDGYLHTKGYVKYPTNYNEIRRARKE